MRTIWRRVVGASAIVIAAVVDVSAQPAVWRERGTISLNAGVQLSSTSFDVSSRHPVYLENSVVDTSYKYRNGTVFDGGVGYRLAGGFGVGFALSWYSQPREIAINAAIPHPFFFRTPRTIAGSASDVRREALAAHLQITYAFHPARRVEVTVGAGPSFLRVRQTIVDDVSFRDTYPYEAPTFTAASTQRLTGHKAGFGASGDVAVRVSRHVGIGGLVRASTADLQFTTPAAIAITKSEAGGVHAAGGVRLYF